MINKNELEAIRARCTQAIEMEVYTYLHKLIEDKNIKTVVETGVCQGFSSHCFLSALGYTRGLLISIGSGIFPANKIVVPTAWQDKWLLIKNSSLNILSTVFKRISTVDFFWHDSKHTYPTQLFEYLTAYPYVKYLGSHDIDKSEAWQEFKRIHNPKVIFEAKNWGLVECKRGQR